MPDLHVIHGDITRLDVDAIVNAANTGLREGSGVCGAIFRAAGAADLQTACDRIGYCATGDAVATPGFALPARWVIHTVGPVWHGGSRDEASLLASCYRRVLEVAADIGALSVAFPAISTGVFGYPAEQAADIAVATVQEARSEIEAVHLVAFDRETERLYRERLEVGGP